MTAPDGTVVIVFAKSPQPGAAKTRLVPLLGEEGAAAFHAKLVKRTIETALAAAFGRIELHCAPDTDDPFFRFCAGHFGVTLQPQAAGDLGSRMFFAFKSALATHACVLLVGSDCPALAAHHLQQADRSLRDGADAVFIPCEDGGYALVGLRRAEPGLFDGIAWGSVNVMAETRARLKQLGWTWCELETLWDVDRPEDYQRLVTSEQ